VIWIPIYIWDFLGLITYTHADNHAVLRYTRWRY